MSRPKLQSQIYIPNVLCLLLFFITGTYTISHVECYDFRGNEWYDATDMHVNRSALSACVIRDLPNLKEYTFYGCQVAEGSDDSDQSQKDDINIEEMPAELRQQ